MALWLLACVRCSGFWYVCGALASGVCATLWLLVCVRRSGFCRVRSALASGVCAALWLHVRFLFTSPVRVFMFAPALGTATVSVPDSPVEFGVWNLEAATRKKNWTRIRDA